MPLLFSISFSLALSNYDLKFTSQISHKHTHIQLWINDSRTLFFVISSSFSMNTKIKSLRNWEFELGNFFFFCYFSRCIVLLDLSNCRVIVERARRSSTILKYGYKTNEWSKTERQRRENPCEHSDRTHCLSESTTNNKQNTTHNSTTTTTTTTSTKTTTTKTTAYTNTERAREQSLNPIYTRT